MSDFKVIEVFKDELNLISSKPLRDFVVECYNGYCPSSYWTVATSTTGKYHPAFVNGEGGLIVHVKYAIWWAQHLVRAFPNLHSSASDEIIAALLLHDLLKNGKASMGDRPRNITLTHGIHLAVDVAEDRREKLNVEEERVLAAIGGHMGVWTEPKSFACWNISDPKTNNIATIVHLADYAAAQKVDKYIESLKVVEVEGTNSVDTPVEIAKEVNKEDIEIIYEFWNSYKGQSKWQSHRKISLDIRNAIIGNLADYSIEDICGAIDNYACVLTSDKYFWNYAWPLSTFLTVKHGKTKLSGKKWWQFLNSNFVKENYLLDKDLNENQDIEDLNPGLTIDLGGIFSCLTNNKEYTPTNSQRSKFIEASIKMTEFFEKRYSSIGERNRLSFVSDCLQKNFVDSGRTLHPGNLCSQEFWEILFPQFMSELGIE